MTAPNERKDNGASSPPRLLSARDDLLGLAVELKNVQAGVRAVDDVDVSAIVRCDIVGLYHAPADVRIALIRAAPVIGVGRDRRERFRILFARVSTGG